MAEMERRAYAVIERKGRILLVRNRSGRWTLPGGRAKQGETFREAARREVLEETGLVVKLGSRIGGRHLRNHPPVCDGCVLYETKRVRGRPRARAEIREFAWVKPKEVPGRLDSFNTKRVARALDGRG